MGPTESSEEGMVIVKVEADGAAAVVVAVDEEGVGERAIRIEVSQLEHLASSFFYCRYQRFCLCLFQYM